MSRDASRSRSGALWRLAAARNNRDISDHTELLAAWTSTVGDDHAALAALDAVIARHREPHRRYHGVHHVTWVVRHVHELVGELRSPTPLASHGSGPELADGAAGSGGVTDLDAVVAAAFFHDAVYDPRAADNEAQSAALATRVLGTLGWNAARCAAVSSMVLATAAHAEPTDVATAVLLDADLAVLGSEPAAYQAYVTGVRAEYTHVSAADWRVGRGQVLRDLLARRPLYATAPARRRWEARASANMTAELATLA